MKSQGWAVVGPSGTLFHTTISLDQSDAITAFLEGLGARRAGLPLQTTMTCFRLSPAFVHSPPHRRRSDVTDDKRQGTASTDGLFRYDGTTTGSAAKPLPTDDKRVAEIRRELPAIVTYWYDWAMKENGTPDAPMYLMNAYNALKNQWVADQEALDATTARLREAEGLLRRARQQGALSFEDMRGIDTFLKGANSG
jgi:hypothetical protein